MSLELQGSSLQNFVGVYMFFWFVCFHVDTEVFPFVIACLDALHSPYSLHSKKWSDGESNTTQLALYLSALMVLTYLLLLSFLSFLYWVAVLDESPLARLIPRWFCHGFYSRKPFLTPYITVKEFISPHNPVLRCMNISAPTLSGAIASIVTRYQWVH